MLAKHSTDALLQRKADILKKNTVSKAITPSQYPFQVFFLCPPVYVDNKINNNVWMKASDKPIDKEKFLAQWYNFYNLLAANSLVYLITPVKGLDDQTYVNSFMYLPHIKKNDVIILSNFTAKGRPGEEIVAGQLFKDLGYQVMQCPYKFEGEPECFDDHTEILTDKGWKFFKDLDQTEVVMTFNPDSQILVYQKPVAYQKYFREGEMIHFKNRYIDSLVTPNHQVYCRNEGTADYHLASADNLRKNFYMKITAPWPEGKDIAYFDVPICGKNKNGQNYKRDYRFPMEQWLRFFGWYISEGYCNHRNNAIWITQSKDKNTAKYNEIYELLTDMGFNTTRVDAALVIYSKRLALYLKQFGLAPDKFIPNEIKELSSKLLHILIDTMIKGDGCYGERTTKYTTNSKQLANDFQEICLKCGIPAIIGIETKKMGDKDFKWYSVYLRERTETIFKHFGKDMPIDRQTYIHNRQWNKEIVNYSGYVYDVTVPEHHILLVRRNGRPFLSGNCKYIRDNVYLGGYGIRTDIRAHQWIRDNFDAKIIPIREKDEKLYHLDCMVFPLGRENAMVCTALMEPEEIKRVEKVVNVIPVSKNGSNMGITNSVKVEDVIFNSSNLQFLKVSDEDYEMERKKNVELEKICSNLGIEIVYVDLSECNLSGAFLSCFVGHGNWRD